MTYLALIITGSTTLTALSAYIGTSKQASLAKQRLFNDHDPLIAKAARYWTPLRWIARPTTRQMRSSLEATLRKNPKRWSKYNQLLGQLSAWNWIETSVAYGATASIAILIWQLIPA